MSAETGEGLDELREAIEARFLATLRADGAARALRRGREPVRAARAGRRARARGHRRGRARDARACRRRPPRASSASRRNGGAARVTLRFRRLERGGAPARAGPRRRRRLRPARRRGGHDRARASAPAWAPGIAVAIPRGHAGLVLPRSGLAARHGISLVNAPGLIDAGYRGELRVLLLNTDRARAVRGRAGRPDRPARAGRAWHGPELQEVGRAGRHAPRRGRLWVHGR